MAQTTRAKSIKPAPKKPAPQRTCRPQRRVAHSEKIMEPEALAQESQLLRILMNTLPDGVTVKDIHGRFLLVNPRAVKDFFRASAEEILGKTDFDLMPAEMADHFRIEEQKIIQTGKPMINALDRGAKLCLLRTKVPLRDKSGKIIGIININRDVTKEELAQEILDAQRQQLLSIFDGIDEIFYVSDPQTYEVLYVNKACREQWGKVTGKKCHEIFHKLKRPCPHCTNEFVFGAYAGQSYVSEFQNLLTGRWYRAFDKAIPWPDGRMVRCQLAIDITERRDAEHAYQTLVEQSLQGIVVLRQFRVVFANEAFARTFGYDLQELTELTATQVRQLVHPSDRADVWRRYREQMQGQRGPEHYEFRGIRRDGGLCWLEMHASQVSYRGEPAVQCVVLDITERKNMEKQIRQQHEQLRSLASELALTGERQRRQIATELHDHIGQLLASAQIRLGALRDDQSEPGVIESLGEIRKLIEQAIKYTRSLTFDLSPPMLYELGLEAALQWLMEKAQKENRFKTEFIDDGRAKEMDDDIRMVLFQSVRELLVNIVKHALAQHISLRISRQPQHVLVELRDDGVGFNPEQVQVGTGSMKGFGLFNIKEHLRYLGGHVEITSHVGQGTCVQLWAPLKQRKLKQ